MAAAEKANKKDTKKKIETKMNKKFVQQHRQQMDDEQDDSSARKRGGGRGGTVMEGSRCSRVNGRGWRCCHQTLVGYSLCQHHLGKGRLRSMTSVRISRSLASSSNNNIAAKIDRQTLSSRSSPYQQAKPTKRESLGENGENGEDDQ